MQTFLQIAMKKSVRLRAFKIAAIVGCVLAAINHGDQIIRSDFNAIMLIKIGFTFLVPYCVSTISSVSAVKEHQQIP